MFYHQHGQTTQKSSSALQKRQQTTYRPAPQANSTHPARLIQRAKLNPISLNADDVLTLQETIGNRAASRMLAGQRATQVQAKLTIGQPRDKYEQEADRVASQVVKQIHAPASAQPTQGQSVQRQDIEEEELQAKPEIKALQRQEESEEELQAKPSIYDLQRVPLSPEVQREAMLEDDNLQVKSILQRQEVIAVGEASTNLESSINSARGGGQPLQTSLQQSMGQAMGADFSGVRVHTDSKSDQLNQSIQAKAFTTGQDMFFRQGEYQPGSRGGQELIAHELTHVVQQNGGAVDSASNTIAREEKTRRELPLVHANRGGRSNDIEVKERGSTLVSRMYKDAVGKISLPDDIEIDTPNDDITDEQKQRVEDFVNALPARPEWYKDENGEVARDTKLTLLAVYPKKEVTDPWTGRTIWMWQCGSCKNGVQYEAIQIGHKEDWKTHLKKLGVKTAQEAKAAYNNLKNLKIECATCNVSHAFEVNSEGDYID